jgi:hypothetical protein
LSFFEGGRKQSKLSDLAGWVCRSNIVSGKGCTIQEANLWRKLKSKDVVNLVGIGASNLISLETVRSSIFIVCEHMDGGTLRSAIEQQMLSKSKQVYGYKEIFRCAARPFYVCWLFWSFP